MKPDPLPLIFEDMLDSPPVKKDADLKELKRLLVAEDMVLVEAIIAVVKSGKIPQALTFIF